MNNVCGLMCKLDTGSFSIGRVAVVEALYKRDGMTVDEIIRFVGSSSTATFTTVNELVKKGILEFNGHRSSKKGGKPRKVVVISRYMRDNHNPYNDELALMLYKNGYINLGRLKLASVLKIYHYRSLTHRELFNRIHHTSESARSSLKMMSRIGLVEKYKGRNGKLRYKLSPVISEFIREKWDKKHTKDVDAVYLNKRKLA